MIRLLSGFLLVALVSACAPLAPQQPLPGAPQPPLVTDSGQLRDRAQRAARTFVQVVETVEPVAETQCRQRTSNANCNFIIVIDDTPGQPPNAFQTVDRAGRPVIAFNLALIASVDNADELAFVMSHEAAHHILGHLDRTRENAAVGAVIFSGLAAASGASASAVRSAEEFGATVGARSYSKEFELEADQLGTIIAINSGYDAVRGADFFMRIPDPGNRFLGSHPPNAQRIDIVRRTAAQM